MKCSNMYIVRTKSCCLSLTIVYREMVLLANLRAYSTQMHTHPPP